MDFPASEGTLRCISARKASSSAGIFTLRLGSTEAFIPLPTIRRQIVHPYPHPHGSAKRVHIAYDHPSDTQKPDEVVKAHALGSHSRNDEIRGPYPGLPTFEGPGELLVREVHLQKRINAELGESDGNVILMIFYFYILLCSFGIYC